MEQGPFGALYPVTLGCIIAISTILSYVAHSVARLAPSDASRPLAKGVAFLRSKTLHVRSAVLLFQRADPLQVRRWLGAFPAGLRPQAVA